MTQREFPAAPLVGVGGVTVNEGRVLLVRRRNEPARGRWSIPGGLIELGESLTAAVVREVKEETGLDVEPIELIKLLDRIHHDGIRVQYHYVIADYLCFVTGGDLSAGSDADMTRWVTPPEWRNGGDLDLDDVTLQVIEVAWNRAQEIVGGKE